MNRVIKFRAWDDLNKEWLMGYPTLGGFSLTGECVLLGEWQNCFDQFIFNKNGKKPEHLIVEQFTGLTDKNGKEIYEGDILEGPLNVDRVITYKTGFELSQRQLGARLYESAENSLVIGNIHEHPHLLC